MAITVGEENKGMHYVAKLYDLLCASSLCFRYAVWHKEEGFEALECGGRQCSAHPAALRSSFPGKQCGPVSTDIGSETAARPRCSLKQEKYFNICTSSAPGNGWTERQSRKGETLLNILTIGPANGQAENILTRAEEVLNDLCKVCWAACEEWLEEG